MTLLSYSELRGTMHVSHEELTYRYEALRDEYEKLLKASQKLYDALDDSHSIFVRASEDLEALL
jgi:hypothetical protein